ncbi:TPA: hypothetical protein ACHJX8_003690 [Yersinia enterocolitica]
MQTESRIDRWLRTGFVLFLIVLVMLIIFNGTAKTSDVSNWIIAFANIVMAAAAVMAWRAARKFLAEFFAQEGYRLAIELINENVIHLGIENKFNVHSHKAIVLCKMIDSKIHTDDKNTQFKIALSELEALQKQHTVWLSNIRLLLFRMETYGIFAAEGKNNPLIDMVCALDRLIRRNEELLPLLRANVDAYDSEIRNRMSIHTYFRSKHLSEMNEIQSQINLEWNQMLLCRTTLLSGGKHARTLFMVRES